MGQRSMKTLHTLVLHDPFILPQEGEVEDDQPTNKQRHRWQFAIYWLVDGPKGPHWCQAPGRNGARTVYRNIPWDGDTKYTMAVAVPARQTLAEDAVFWVKQPYEPSKPYRIIRSEQVPAPGAHDQIRPARRTTNKTLA